MNDIQIWCAPQWPHSRSQFFFLIYIFFQHEQRSTNALRIMLNTGGLWLSGSSQCKELFFRVAIENNEFARKIMIMEVNKCSLMNLKFAINTMIFLYFWIWHNMIIFLVLSCTLSKGLCCTLYILFKEEIVIVL